MDLDPYSPLHSPQHRGYPDALPSTLTPSEGETLPDLQPPAVSTVEGHFHSREKDQLRARIEWLENHLQGREEMISLLADEIGRLKAGLQQIADHSAATNLAVPWKHWRHMARDALKACANS